MSISKKLFHLIVLFTIVGSVNAHPVFIPNCPPEISTSQKLLHSFEGWRPFNISTHHYLSNIEMYDGNPEALACLKPDSHSDEKTVWHFRHKSTNYMVCQYNDTRIQLTKSLPPTVTQCTLWYKKYSLNKTGGNIPDHILCQ